jgi:hypothetical protein
MIVEVNTKGLSKDKRRLLYPESFLEYDKTGLLYYSSNTPEFILGAAVKAGDPYKVSGRHITIYDLIAKKADSQLGDYNDY